MGHPLLAEVFDRIAHVLQHGGLPLVILDLDGTLLRTGTRHLGILREFLESAEDGLDGLTELRAMADSFTPESFGYFVTDPLDAGGLGEKAALKSALTDYWSVRYFTSQWCVQDLPAPGAHAFVSAVRAAGGRTWYATGRPEATMGVGTRVNLQHHTFPIDDLSGLAMRGAEQETDADFKEAIVATAAQAHVVATFENEPAHANLFAEAFPDALHFLVGAVRSPSSPEPRRELIPTEDFVLPAPPLDIDALLEASQLDTYFVPGGTQVHAVEGHQVLVSALPSDRWNQAVLVEPVAPDAIPALLDGIDALHRPGASRISVFDRCASKPLTKAMTERGYTLANEHYGCAIDPRALPVRPVPGITTRPVTNRDELRVATQTMFRAFGRTDAVNEDHLEQWLPTCVGPNARCHRVVAFDDATGEPLCTGGLNVFGAFGLLWGGGTIPDARGRGAWTAVLNARAVWAIEHDLARIGMYARVESSLPLALARGFRRYSRATYWERPAEGSPWRTP